MSSIRARSAASPCTTTCQVRPNRLKSLHSAAQNRLQRGEDIAQVDAQRLHLVAVDIEEELRRVGRIGGEDARQLRPLVGGEDEAPRHGGKIGGGRAPEALQLELEAAAGAKPDDRRRL